jgi:hypothetical protein
MKTATIYLFVLLLAGCATRPAVQYQWVHATGAASFDQDFGQCEAQALGTHPLMPQEQAVALFGACMRGKGWRLVQR